jgi:catechol 2,3-dioxygenase-like lactoylglutathione lyase family enzyme
MRLTILVLSIMGARGLSAQAPVFNATGAFFALSVPDVQASSRWYSEKLGLRVTMNIPASNSPAVIVLEGGGLIVELIQHADAKASGRDPVLTHGFTKAGFMVEDLDRTLVALRERSVEIAYGPFPKRADQRANVIIKDNGGNLIQLFGR